MAEPSRARVTAGLGLSVLAISCSAPLIVLAAPLHPLLIAALRVCCMGLLWTLLARGQLAQTLTRLRTDRRALGAVWVAAVFLAGHFACWTACLSYTSVVQGAVLVSMTPLFAGLLGRLLGDFCPPRFYLGTGIAIGGVWLMARAGGAATAAAPAPLLGGFLAALASVLAAVYFLAGRSVRHRLPLAGYLAAVNSLAGALLLAVVLVIGPPWHPAGAGTGQYLAILGLALIPGLTGHGLQNWAARHLPVHLVSLTVLLEPPGATLLAWLLLDQGVAALELVGAGVLLGGVALGLPRWRGRARTQARERKG